jgi:hypothetical protein
MKRSIARVVPAVITLGVSLALMGCDWSSGGGADGFNSSRIANSVAGVYRAPTAGSPLVTDYASDGSGGVQTVSGERIGTGDGSRTTFSGTLSRVVVVPGTVKVFGSGFTFSDDGSGNLVGSPSGSGSITYDNGAISVDFGGTAPDSGDAITVDYSYQAEFNAGVGSGASATTIYSFSVRQNGDRVTFTDNNGDSYSGRLGGSSIDGDPASDTRLRERIQYEVAGSSRGIAVKITGTFTVDLSVQGVATETDVVTDGDTTIERETVQPYAVTELRMDGTWIEPNAQGNVRGVVN